MRHVSEKLSKARLEEKQGENIPAKARPCFHLTACKGWMNDPNGFIYYRGAYHLFISIILTHPDGDSCTGDMLSAGIS